MEATISALQAALKEKTQHIDQLLRERDMEISEVAKATADAEEWKEKWSAREAEVVGLRDTWEAKVASLKETVDRCEADRNELTRKLVAKVRECAEARCETEEVRFRADELIIDAAELRDLVEKSEREEIGLEERVLKENKDALEEKDGLKEREEGLQEEEAGLKEKEAGLKKKEAGMTEKEAGLKEKEAGLKEKVAGMKAKEEDLKKNVAALKEKEESLKEKEQGLMEKETALKEKEGLMEKVAGMKEKEEGLMLKEEGLKEKEAGLMLKETGLKEKEEGLKGKAAGLKEGLTGEEGLSLICSGCNQKSLVNWNRFDSNRFQKPNDGDINESFPKTGLIISKLSPNSANFCLQSMSSYKNDYSYLIDKISQQLERGFQLKNSFCNSQTSLDELHQKILSTKRSIVLVTKQGTPS